VRGNAQLAQEGNSRAMLDHSQRMRPFSSPDQVVYRYMELLERLGSARGQNPVASSGYVFRYRCKRGGCGSRERVELIQLDKQGRTIRTAWVCVKCGDPWGVEIGFLMKREVKGGRRTSIEDLYSELGTLSKWLSLLGHWERRIYVQLYLCEQVGDYRDVALTARKRYPRSKRSWTTKRVRTIVQHSREVLSYRILKANWNNGG